MESLGKDLKSALSYFNSDLVRNVTQTIAPSFSAADNYVKEENVMTKMMGKSANYQEALIKHAIATADITVDHTADDLLRNFDLPTHTRLIRFRAKDMSSGDMVFPFLILPVNPDLFRVEYKKRSDVEYTLGGFVITHWHDDVTTITASGYIPTFRNKAKVLTSSFRAFLTLLQMYKEAGQPKLIGTVFPSTGTQAQAQLNKLGNTQAVVAPSVASAVPNGQAPKTVGPDPKDQTISFTLGRIQNSIIELGYMSDIYKGIFTSFVVEEAYEQPNTLKYTFTFKAVEVTDILFGNLDDNTHTDVMISSPVNFRGGGR